MLEKLPAFILGTGDRVATFMFYVSDNLFFKPIVLHCGLKCIANNRKCEDSQPKE